MEPSTLKIVSWNIAHRSAAWELLSTVGADIVLLQEAIPPPPEVDSAIRVLSPPTGDWRVNVRGSRPYATAIAISNPALGAEQLPVVAIADAGPEDLASTHPGQFTVARVPWRETTLTLVSLYGIWERQDGVGIYSEATLHHALSDLTPLMQRRDPLLIAGDLNIFYGYALPKEKYWQSRYQTVFDRFAAYGLDLIGPFAVAPLDGCRCGPADDCRHVRTYRHMNRADSSPDQLDFAFANEPVRSSLRSCDVLDRADLWTASDHAPLCIELEA